jgi:hypothetical protein
VEVLDDSAVAQAVDYLARCLCRKAASVYHLEFVIYSVPLARAGLPGHYAKLEKSSPTNFTVNLSHLITTASGSHDFPISVIGSRIGETAPVWFGAGDSHASIQIDEQLKPACAPYVLTRTMKQFWRHGKLHDGSLGSP